MANLFFGLFLLIFSLFHNQLYELFADAGDMNYAGERYAKSEHTYEEERIVYRISEAEHVDGNKIYYISRKDACDRCEHYTCADNRADRYAPLGERVAERYEINESDERRNDHCYGI